MRRRDHLAGAVDVVVISIDLDQAGISLDAVHIVIQLAVLADDTVFHFGIGIRIGRDRRRVKHLAVRAEVIEACRKKAVGAVHPVVRRRDHLAGAVDVVVISVDLDQAGVGRDAINIVPIFSIDLHDTIIVRIGLHDHVTIFIEIIETFRKPCIIGVRHPVPSVLHSFIITGKVVIVSVFCQIQAIADCAVDRIVCVSVQLE